MMEERHKQRENKERGEEEDDGGRLEACQLMCFVQKPPRVHRVIHLVSTAGSPGPVRHGHKGG